MTFYFEALLAKELLWSRTDRTRTITKNEMVAMRWQISYTDRRAAVYTEGYMELL